MPTLVLPSRYTEDSIALWKAAIAADWDVERLQNWSVPPGLGDRDPVLYGEPLFAAAVADRLSLKLVEPPPVGPLSKRIQLGDRAFTGAIAIRFYLSCGLLRYQTRKGTIFNRPLEVG